MDTFINKLFLIILIIFFSFIIVNTRTAAKEKENMLMLNNTCIKYDSYERLFSFDVYYDGNQEYIYKDGKIAGYINNEQKENRLYTINNKSIINGELFLKEKSHSILKGIVGDRIDNYSFNNYVYDQNYHQHIYSYTVYYNNIETDDTITIRFRDDGTLESFNSPYIGEFDSIDINITESNFLEYIDNLYGEYDYSIDYYTLRKDEKGYYIQGLIGIIDHGFNYAERVEMRL